MTQSVNPNLIPSQSFPHVFWVDLRQDGILTEIAVVKQDQLGNTYFFPIGTLDNIDKNRLKNILASRNADRFPLWDLMQSVTLGNGVNALEYFHQLVKILTISGQVMEITSGKIGAPIPPAVQSIKPEPSQFAG